MTLDFAPFSIVIPAKNEEQTLPRCIHSILAMLLLEDCEIIVVSDKISLMSLEMFSRYLPFGANLHLIESEADMIGAMNIGIQRAKNDVIVKLDADIAIFVGHIIELVKRLDEFDLVSCPAVTFGKTLIMQFLFAGRNILQRFSFGGLQSNGNTLIFRRSDLIETGGFQYDTKLHLQYLKLNRRVFVDRLPYAKEYRPDYSVKFCKKRQIESGFKRFELGVPFTRSLFHAIARGRPFVVAGYLKAKYGGCRIESP